MADTVKTDIQIYATDNLLTDRNRPARVVVALVCLAGALMLPYLVGSYILGNLLGLGWLGGLIGLIFGTVLVDHFWKHFVIQNDSVQAFVTIDQLWTLLGGNKDPNSGDKQVYVSYGPGFHLCFPWESRTEKNNVPLEEVSESFTLTTQTQTGTVTFKGSLRMRADIRHLVSFISGVAAIPGDITDLIKTFIIQWTAGKSIDDVLANVKDLNEDLQFEFGLIAKKTASGALQIGKSSDVSNFERRFGVNVSDVTIAEVLPSKEAQKTRSAIDEAVIIAEGTARLLGFTPDDIALPYPKTAAAKANEALAAKTLTRAEYERAQARFMAASENITMTATDFNLNLSGVDPDVAKALSAIAPLIAQWMSQGDNKKGGK